MQETIQLVSFITFNQKSHNQLTEDQKEMAKANGTKVANIKLQLERQKGLVAAWSLKFLIAVKRQSQETRKFKELNSSWTLGAGAIL